MKALLKFPNGDCYALPARDLAAARRILAHTVRVRDGDELQYDGMAAPAVELVPPDAIHGLPTHLKRARAKRLTGWYLGSLTAVSYTIASTATPRWLDGALIIGATLVTMWLRERDWI